MLSHETEPVRIPTRRSNEGTKSYQRRLSRMLPEISHQKTVINPDLARRVWRENAYDLIIAAYYGFIAEQGEIANDNLGMSVEHGSSVSTYRDGVNAFEEAYHMTYGKPINLEDFIEDELTILNADERRSGKRLPLKREFLGFTRERATEMRQEDQRANRIAS